jgi:hypothetical protein
MEPMRLKKKSGYDHGDLRRTLLDVSIAVIDKHGVDARPDFAVALAGSTTLKTWKRLCSLKAISSAIRDGGMAEIR